jgi:hypothetical protein
MRMIFPVDKVFILVSNEQRKLLIEIIFAGQKE